VTPPPPRPSPAEGEGDRAARYYPAFLDLRGQPCVVLGGGELATEKALGLLRCGAAVTVIAPEAAGGLRALAGGGALAWRRRAYRAGDLAGARLVIDASEDERVNEASWREAEARGALINVVDRPHRCRFIAPAVVDRDPLLIAISTSGESPFLASALRARLERLFGEEWSPFVGLVGAVRRRLRARGVPATVQTQVYRRLLRSRVRRLIRSGLPAEARREADAIAAAAEGEAPAPPPHSRGRAAVGG
jgi:siroheme synthase-like protein